MTIAEGEVQYEHGAVPFSGTGILRSSKELDAALNGHVAPLVFDDEGKADIDGTLSGLAETEFAQEGLRAILQMPMTLKSGVLVKSSPRPTSPIIEAANFPGLMDEMNARADRTCRR